MVPTSKACCGNSGSGRCGCLACTFPQRQTLAGSIVGAITVVGGSTDSVVGVEDGSMAAAGDGSTAGAMAAEVHGSTAGKHLYRRPPLQRVARSSARLRKRSGNSNRFSNRQKSWPSTLENPDAHLPCRSLSTIRISQKSEVSIAGDTHNPRIFDRK